MKNFIYHNPTKILFGKGMIEKLGPEMLACSVKKVLLHYGKNSIFNTGLYEKVVEMLKTNNIEFVECGGVKANPSLNKVYEAIEVCKKENVDAILAVGGGSVIDSAKATGRGFYYDGDVWDLFEGKGQSEKCLPIFTILTISATGSEMNGNSVISNEKENKKWPMAVSIDNYPKVSVIDPELQKTLPVSQIVNGAADIMAHVFEFYFDGSKDSDLTNEFCEGIIRTTMKQTELLVNNSDNYEARANFAWSATQALNMLLQPGRNGGDWATHMIEHSVSMFYDIAHGAGLAILFPAWMKYVYEENLDQFERFAERIFGITEGAPEEKALEAIIRLIKFYKDIGAPVTLKEVGVKEEDLEKMAENVVLRGPVGKLLKLKKADVTEIYKLAYQ